MQGISLENFLAHYGYLALFIGTFLEGETILILGGISAKIGYLKLPGVITAAFLGTLAGDQLFFFLGRLKGQKFIANRPKWQSKAKKVNHWLEMNEKAVIVGFRFFYGFRTVTPFVIGMSSIRTGKFLFFNILGALIWAVVIGGVGYFFGHALDLALGHIRHFEISVLVGVAVVGAVIWLWHFFVQRKDNRL